MGRGMGVRDPPPRKKQTNSGSSWENTASAAEVASPSLAQDYYGEGSSVGRAPNGAFGGCGIAARPSPLLGHSLIGRTLDSGSRGLEVRSLLPQLYGDSGETGSRACLWNKCRKACGFKSHLLPLLEASVWRVDTLGGAGDAVEGSPLLGGHGPVRNRNHFNGERAARTIGPIPRTETGTL